MSDTVISDWIKLGAYVRAARHERGWTQIQLAQRAGVSRAWLARLESGHRRAELESILRLFAALDLRLLARASNSGGVNGAPEAGHVLNLVAAEAAVADSRSAATSSVRTRARNDNQSRNSSPITFEPVDRLAFQAASVRPGETGVGASA